MRSHASAGGGRIPAGAESELSGLQSLGGEQKIEVYYH